MLMKSLFPWGIPSYAPTAEGLIETSVDTAIVLIIWGILYGLLYERLLGNKPFFKAFPLGIAISIIGCVENTLSTLARAM